MEKLKKERREVLRESISITRENKRRLDRLKTLKQLQSCKNESCDSVLTDCLNLLAKLSETEPQPFKEFEYMCNYFQEKEKKSHNLYDSFNSSLFINVYKNDFIIKSFYDFIISMKIF